jgi:hypothetical protein
MINTVRITDIDGKQRHYMGLTFDYNGMWVQAVDSETKQNTWIPARRIATIVVLPAK